MSAGGDKFKGLPDENPLFMKISSDSRMMFCLIMADFCKFFQCLGLQSPGPLSPTLMKINSKFKHNGWLRLKGLFYPACLARIVSWLAFVAVIFMAHKNGDDTGKPRDGTCKACWLKQTL